jgi:hypothetical protein
MNTSRTLTVAAASLLAVCVASPAFAQSKVTKKKTATINRTNSKIPTKPTPKKPIQRGETNEQRLVRLKNEGRRDRCVEALEEALNAKVTYDEHSCRMTIKQATGSNPYSFSFSLTSVNISTGNQPPQKFRVSCRSQTKKCIRDNRGTSPSGMGETRNAGLQIRVAPSEDLAACMEFLKNRCKP